MEELAKLEKERGDPEYMTNASTSKKERFTDNEKSESLMLHNKKRTASKEMCDFLILKFHLYRLIPVNMIVYRQQYGSVNPAAVIAPAIVATFISTAVGVVFCKVKDRKRRR